MNNNSSLDLNSPPRHKPGKDSFNIREPALRHWLANLPAVNPNETGKALLDALTRVNQLKISHSARLRFLETIRPSVHEIAIALGRQSLPGRFPQPKRNQHLEQLADRLLHEQAIGYHSIVQDLSSTKRRRGSKQLALAIQRAMHTLGRLLINCSSRYQPPPKNLWQHLHELYRTAERYDIAQRKVSDLLLKQNRHSSAANIYKQILLLAAAEPYRMRFNEIDDAYLLFERWAPSSQLLHNDGDSSKAAFFIDLDSDKPPFCQRIDCGSRSIRMLDTSSLSELAAAERQRPRWWQFRRRKAQAPDPGLVQRLIITLGMPPVRQSIRLPTSASVQVLIGLPHIHRGLTVAQGLNILDADIDEPTFTGRDLKTDTGQNSDDIWDLIYPSDLLRAVHDNSAVPTNSNPPPTLEQNWQVVNASIGGYCLLSNPSQATKAQINELIALREYGDNHSIWQLGAIRWIRQLPDGLQVGVRILGKEPSPVLSQTKEQSNQPSSPTRSLLLPANDMKNRPATLLTSPLRHETGQRILLSYSAHKNEVLLTQLMESCSGFAQFEYQTTTQAAATKKPTPQSAGPLVS